MTKTHKVEMSRKSDAKLVIRIAEKIVYFLKKKKRKKNAENKCTFSLKVKSNDIAITHTYKMSKVL